MAQTLKFGNRTWATKEGSTLAYNDENGNYKPFPLDFDRAGTATRVNKEGLIEVVGRDKPRIDYTDSSEGALLLEPSSTNYIPYSEDFSQSAWYKGNSTITSNTGISPEGIQNADNLYFNGTSNAVLKAVTMTTSGKVYTFSIWIKKISANYTNNVSARIEVFGSGAVGTLLLGDALNSAAVGEFVKYSITTSASTGGRSDYQFRSDEEATFEVWGAQLEQGSYATSYIPTQGSAVTRVADVGGSTGDISSVVNSQEGTFMFEGSFSDQNLKVSLNSSTTTFSNRISIRTMSDTQFRIDYFAGGVGNQAFFNVSSTKDNAKIAIKWISGSLVVYHNGTEVVDVTNIGDFSPNILNRISLSAADNTSNKFKGRAKQFRVYDEYLSNAEMVKLTTL